MQRAGAHHAALIVEHARHECGEPMPHACRLLVAVRRAPASGPREERHGYAPAVRGRHGAIQRHDRGCCSGRRACRLSHTSSVAASVRMQLLARCLLLSRACRFRLDGFGLGCAHVASGVCEVLL